MQEPRTILSNAFRGSLDDLREQYERLAALEPEARAHLVTDTNAKVAVVQDAITHPDTQRAKDVLLSYQYTTRFVYDVDPKSKRHFVDVLSRSLWQGHESEIANWNWHSPNKEEFLCAVQTRLPSADFYTQVNLLCNELFGLSLPSAPETSFAEWSKMVSLNEAGWAWRYDNQVKEEKARWFSSQKRVNAIEAQRAEHRVKASRCVDQIRPIFSELNPAKSKLEDLKSKELWLSIHCTSLNKAFDAMQQGVQLKHLLLEEAHGLDKAFKAATRGL
jgi:hypothetical protein